MNIKDYVKTVLKREMSYLGSIERLSEKPIRILHASMGLATESGEILEQIKKHIFYGKPLDEVNLVEECGDLLWYMAVMLDSIGVSFEEVMEANDRKLELRYRSKFTDNAANNRDLKAERKALEDG